MYKIKIAIDGPSSAGKSTISKIISQKLGFLHIDTGAIYRSIALLILKFDIDIEDEEKIALVLKQTKLNIYFVNKRQIVYIDGQNVTEKLRTPKVSLAASGISKFLPVRKKVTEISRKSAKNKNIIMDGRDIGTHILPYANLKIFLTASLKDRAKRRYEEFKERNVKITLKEVESDLNARDTNDSKRNLDPLKPATDAVIIDTTGNTLEKSIQIIFEIVQKRVLELSGFA